MKSLIKAYKKFDSFSTSFLFGKNDQMLYCREQLRNILLRASDLGSLYCYYQYINLTATLACHGHLLGNIKYIHSHLLSLHQLILFENAKIFNTSNVCNFSMSLYWQRLCKLSSLFRLILKIHQYLH